MKVLTFAFNTFRIRTRKNGMRTWIKWRVSSWTVASSSGFPKKSWDTSTVATVMSFFASMFITSLEAHHSLFRGFVHVYFTESFKKSILSSSAGYILRADLHKAQYYDERFHFFIRDFSNRFTPHRNALAAWTACLDSRLLCMYGWLYKC